MNLIPFLITIGFVYCMVVIPERCEFEYVNNKYLKYARCQVRRYGRKSPYYFNVWSHLHQTWFNNVSMDVIFNEYLNNEYRRSFIEFHYKGCEDFFKNDIYMANTLRNVGVQCPVPAGEIALENLTVPAQDFPNVFPYRRARVDFILFAGDHLHEIVQMNLYITFKQDIIKKKH